MVHRILLLLIAGGCPGFVVAQGVPGWPGIPRETLPPILAPWELVPPAGKAARNVAFPAHRVVGNMYYVGTSDLASFLITSPQGHIFINPDYEESVPSIQKSVEQLGFRFQDIKIILLSHAHDDHCGGTARVKELTGAQVMVMDGDADAMEQGLKGNGGFPAVKVSRVLHDKDEVRLGGNVLVARLTAGHTKGCTTWALRVRDGDKNYNVVIVGSVSVNNANVLADSNAVDDYRRSFKVLRELPCDIFLAAHAMFYGLDEKYKKLGKGGSNPFVDPEGYRAHVNMMEKVFYYKLDWAMRQK